MKELEEQNLVVGVKDLRLVQKAWWRFRDMSHRGATGKEWS